MVHIVWNGDETQEIKLSRHCNKKRITLIQLQGRWQKQQLRLAFLYINQLVYYYISRKCNLKHSQTSISSEKTNTCSASGYGKGLFYIGTYLTTISFQVFCTDNLIDWSKGWLSFFYDNYNSSINYLKWIAQLTIYTGPVHCSRNT